MKKNVLILLLFPACLKAQDTTQNGHNYIVLSEVVVHKNLDVPAFIERVKNDTGFYKAFKNLRILGFDAINDVRMLNKKGKAIALLESKTRQQYKDSCRTMEILEERTKGDIYTRNGDYNYYTLSMYASLFFTQGKICGETNVVGDKAFSTEGKKGMEKHKEQLKMLFFNPGQRISGLPFMSNKTNMFSKKLADDYALNIDYETFNGQNCYVFRQNVLPGHERNVVIRSMTTYFRDTDFEIVKRTYHLKYHTAFYDFDVNMEVEMTSLGTLTVPVNIRYNGNWKVATKKRERGIFTATLSNFNLSNH